MNRFRSMWERYCRGVNAIVYMVDAADPDKIEASRLIIKNGGDIADTNMIHIQE